MGFHQDIRASNNIQIQKSISKKSITNVDDLASETPFIDTVVNDKKEPNLEISNKYGIENIENKIIKQGVVMNKQPYLKTAYDVVLASKEQSREELPAFFLF